MECCESQCLLQQLYNFHAKHLSGRERLVSFLLCHMFLNLFELFSSNNLLIPSEWILVWFSTPVLKGILFLPVQYNPCRVCTSSGPYNPLPVLQVGNSSNQAYLLMFFFFQITFKNFTRYSFKALFASICRLPFAKALPQCTIYVQAMVQFAF